MEQGDATLDAIEKIYDTIFPSKATSPSEKSGTVGHERAKEMAIRAVEGAAELHRRLKDLGETQDRLAKAMDAVSRLHEAACNGNEDHSLAGVGIQVTSDIGGFRIKKLLKNSPSDMVSGSLTTGDRLLTIDGQDLSDKTLSEVTAMLTGPTNTKVTIEGQRDGTRTPRAPYVVSLRRAGKEGDTRPVSEICKDALEAIKEMREKNDLAEKTDAKVRRLAAALDQAQSDCQLERTNAQKMQEELGKQRQIIAAAEERAKDHDKEFEKCRHECKQLQSQLKECEQKFLTLTDDKKNLSAAAEKTTADLQDALRKLDLQSSALLVKAEVEKKLHKAILEAHEVRGELAKSRAQAEEGESEIKRLQAELEIAKKKETEIADFKERLKVAHRRLTESQEEIMRLRPFEKAVSQLEKSLQSKGSELSNALERLQTCEVDLKGAMEREESLGMQLKSLKETADSKEEDLKKQLAVGAGRIVEIGKALTARQDECNAMQLQMQIYQKDLDSANDAIKQGIERERIADQKNVLIQRSLAENANVIATLETQLQKVSATLEAKLPALQKEVLQLNVIAKERQEAILEKHSKVEGKANELSIEMQGILRESEKMLQESRKREAQQMLELDGCRSEIDLLKGALQSKDVSIRTLQAEIEAKCKALASANTQYEISMIKCVGLERESNEFKAEIRLLTQTMDQLKSTLTCLQGKLTASESKNADLNTQITLMTEERRVDTEKWVKTEKNLKEKIEQLQEGLRACSQQLGKTSNQLSASEAHASEQTKQIHSLKSTVSRLEMRIRALESEKGGITLEKGGLTHQLEKLDSDYRALQQQLVDSNAALNEIKHNREQIQALYDELQVKHEATLQEVSDIFSDWRKLVDACNGHIVQHKGVGMVVRAIGDGPGGNLTWRNIHSQDYVVKELVAGGAAANCGQIKAGDILMAVDGVKVQGMNLDEVQFLILGQEGTTVVLAFLNPSPTGGVRYSRMLVRGENAHGSRSRADEAKEAIEAVNGVHQGSRALKSRMEELASLLAAAKSNIMELDKITAAQNDTMHQLNKDVEDWKAKAAANEGQFRQIQGALRTVKDEHSTCDSERSSLQRTISELKSKITHYESRLDLLGCEKAGNASKLVQVKAELSDLQQKFEKVLEREASLQAENADRENKMKMANETLQEMYEKALQEASDNATAGRGLINAIAGRVVERVGVGMVVQQGRGGAMLVKNILPGGSAALCEQLELNDVIVAVDGIKIAGVPLDQVQHMIVGPKGTTVTITGLKVTSPTGGERYSVKLLRGDSSAETSRAFSSLAKEAIDAMNDMHYQAKKDRESFSQLEARIAELESVVQSRDGKVALLQSEVDALKTKLVASNREKDSAESKLYAMTEKHCTCENGRKEDAKAISDLSARIKAMESKAAEAEGLKRAFDDSFKKERELNSHLAELQAKYEAAIQRASERESTIHKLLDAMSGHTVERKGVGMVVRIETSNPNGEYQVKQLTPGGSASKSIIKVGDTILEVDGQPIKTLGIEKVQEMIIGPEGTMVTITGLDHSEDEQRYSVSLVRGEPKHSNPIEEETRDALSKLNQAHQEASEAKSLLKGLQDKSSADAAQIAELNALMMNLKVALESATQENAKTAEQAVLWASGVDDLKTKILQLEKSNALLQANLAGTNDALRRSTNDLKSERSLSAETSDKLAVAMTDLQKMKKKLQNVTRSLDAESSNLRIKLEASESEVSSLRQKTGALADENKALSCKCSEALEALQATTEAVCGQNMHQCGVGMIVRVEDRAPSGGLFAGSLFGIGMTSSSSGEDGGKYDCTITSFTPGGPAATSGVLECGDKILTINGSEIRGLPLSMVQEMIVGPAGSAVVLTGTHMNSEAFSVELLRGATTTNRQSQSMSHLAQSTVAIAKGMHKDIAHLSISYVETQKEIQALKTETQYAMKREEALKRALRELEQHKESTSGSLTARMAEIEVIKNDLQEVQNRLESAVKDFKKEKAKCEELETANARLYKQTSDLTSELENKKTGLKDLEQHLKEISVQAKQAFGERDTVNEKLLASQHEVQNLKARVTYLEDEVDEKQRKLERAASARQDLDALREMQNEELTNLKKNSIVVLESLADAEKNLSSLRQEAEGKFSAYVDEVKELRASLSRERDMSAAADKQLEMAKIEVTACRKLLDVMKGHVGERKGVGMVVRTHTEKKGHYKIRELIDGGSAALCGKMKVGDTLIEVDGVQVMGLSIDDVQNLIVGPEGSAVTIKCHSDSENATEKGNDDKASRFNIPLISSRGIQDMQQLLTFRSNDSATKGFTYSVTLLRGDWAQMENLNQHVELACARVLALQAEGVEAKKFMDYLLQESKARHAALFGARSKLEDIFRGVGLPLQKKQKDVDAGEICTDLKYAIDIDASTFTRFDDKLRTEIENARTQSDNVLSDLVRMAEVGLQCFKEQSKTREEQGHTIMALETRSAQQADTIRQLEDKLARTGGLLKTAQEQIEALQVRDKEIFELKEDQQLKSKAIADLRNQLARELENNKDTENVKKGLKIRLDTLQTELKEAEIIGAQQSELYQTSQDKLMSSQAFYKSRVSKLEHANEELSKELREIQQAYEKAKTRCEQQLLVISDVKETLSSSETQLKALGEENEVLQERLKVAEDDLSRCRAHLHAALEEHAEKMARLNTKMESDLQEQEHLRRKLESVKRDKENQRIYVAGVEGTLLSREQSVSDLQREITALREELHELSGLKVELNQSKADLSACKSRIATLQNSHAEEEESMKAKWSDSLEECERLSRKMLTVEAKNDFLGEELISTVRAAQRMYSAITAVQGGVPARSTTTESVEVHAEECEAKAKTASNTIKDLNHRVDKLKTDLEQASQRCESLNKDLTGARQQVIEQTEIAHKKSAALKVSDAAHEEACKINQQLQKKLDAFQASKQKLENQLSEAEESMKTLASDLAQSRSDRESEKEKYEKEYANLQGQLDLREKAYAVLERELETRHSTQRSEVEEYEHRLNTVTQELESLRANEGFLEHKERQSNHEARTAAATADELRGETARLNKELSCTNEEVDLLRKQLEEGKALQDETAAKLSESMHELGATKVLLQDLRDNLDKAQSIEHQLNAKIVELRMQHHETERLVTESEMKRQNAVEEAESKAKITERRNSALSMEVAGLKNEISKQKNICGLQRVELDKIKQDYRSVKQELDMYHAAGKEARIGVGLLITERPPHRVLSVVENGSASATGKIAEGDIILGIDGTDVEHQDFKLVRGMLMGQVGSRVHLAMKRGIVEPSLSEAEHYNVTITRGLKTQTSKVIEHRNAIEHRDAIEHHEAQIPQVLAQ